MSDGRKELGAFLRRRRAQLDRSEYGLPPGGRGAMLGLRREEVATFAGVSVTWYTWLEQGRPINPSDQVLDAVARVLKLDDAERGFVASLVRPTNDPANVTLATSPPHLKRLIDSFDSPAFVIASDWTIVDWNLAYTRLYPAVETIEPEKRNLLRLVFTDPSLRSLLVDWEMQAQLFLGEFRAQSGSQLGTVGHSSLVRELREASPEFDRLWAERPVGGFASRRRVFRDAAGGHAVFEQHLLSAADVPALRIILYLPLTEHPADESAG